MTGNRTSCRNIYYFIECKFRLNFIAHKIYDILIGRTVYKYSSCIIVVLKLVGKIIDILNKGTLERPGIFFLNSQSSVGYRY